VYYYIYYLSKMSKGAEGNKSGWLIREEADDGVISWKRRWSCVEDGYLSFYKKQNKKQMLDKVDLRAASKIVPATYKNKKHCWQIQGTDKTTSLLASSESEMALWIKAAFMSKVAAGQSGGTPRSTPVALPAAPQSVPGIVLSGTPDHTSGSGRRGTISMSSGGAPPPPPPPPGPGAFKQNRPPSAVQPTPPRPNPMADPNGTPASPPTGMGGGFMAELSAALGGGRQSLRPTTPRGDTTSNYEAPSYNPPLSAREPSSTRNLPIKTGPKVSSTPSTPVGSPNSGLGLPPRGLNSSGGNVPPPRPAPKKVNDSSAYPPLPPTPKDSAYPPLPPLPPAPKESSYPPLPPLPPTPNDPRSSRVLPSAPTAKVSPTTTRAMPTPTSPGLKQPSAQPTNKQATKEALKALSANSGGAGLRMRQASVRSFESVAKAAARPLPTPGVKKSITPAARPLPTPSAGKRSLPTRPAAATNGGGKSAKRSLKDFEVLEMLGRGAFGRVYRVKLKENPDEIYAMKVIDKAMIAQHKSIAQQSLTERDVLTLLDHPYIVHLYYCFQTESHLVIVMQLVTGGDIYQHLTTDERFDEDRVRHYAAQVLLAVEYLHSKSLMWRDLKPENLLLDKDGNIVLTDFGLAKTNIARDGRTATLCGTPQYLAPEILEGKGYTPVVDWWAFGVLVYEMLTGVPPFNSSNAYGVYKKIKNGEMNFLDDMSGDAIDLISALLEPNLEERLCDPQGLKEHPFFASIDWSKMMNKELPAPSFTQIGSNEVDQESLEDIGPATSSDDIFKSFDWAYDAK
jgi:serine/threonine protein kinase